MRAGPARASGLLAVPVTAGTSDHACWGYADDADRASIATAWIDDGLRLGQRALYIADGSAEQLLAELSRVREVDRALVAGALVVLPSTALYDLSAPIDQEVQLAVYADAVEQASADGYDGVRVAADITPLVVDADRHASHSRWEQFVDRYIAEHPLAPLCLYDVRRVRGIDTITCAHPLQGPQPAPFGLFAKTATAAALDGELDACTVDVFTEVLRQLPETDTEIDASSLRFIDGRSAWALEREIVRRRAGGQDLVVTGASPMMRRVWHLCGYDDSLLPA